MKKIIYAALATTLVFSLTDAAAKIKKKVQKIGTTSVWKVSKNGNSIYLGGTVHLLRAEDYPLPAAYEKAYNASEVLTFETDTKAVSNPEMAQEVMKKGSYQDDRTLETVLSKEVYSLLEAEATKQGLPMAFLNRMKPGLVIATLSAMQMKKDGMGEEGVDMHFTNRGEDDKKGIEQLESISSQLDRITEMGEGNEDEFVKYSLKDLVDMKDKMDDLISEWRNGSPMADEINLMKKDYPAMYKSLLVDRNNNWMPKILSYLDNGTKAFVLVGSLHLHGEDGLLSLLQKQGYQIEQQ